MKEKELEIHLIQFVLEFGTKMNELETEIVEKDQNNPEQDYFEEFKTKYLPIFKEYCSDKKRVYSGNADAYGTPTSYDGIENAIEQKTEIKNKNRAEVYFNTNNNFNAEYLFIVIRKKNLWKIDSVKYRWFKNPKWKSKIL